MKDLESTSSRQLPWRRTPVFSFLLVQGKKGLSPNTKEKMVSVYSATVVRPLQQLQNQTQGQGLRLVVTNTADNGYRGSTGQEEGATHEQPTPGSEGRRDDLPGEFHPEGKGAGQPSRGCARGGAPQPESLGPFRHSLPARPDPACSAQPS